MNAEMTQAKIGRVMKKREIMPPPCVALFGVSASSALAPAASASDGHRADLHARLHLQHAFDDVTIAGRRGRR